MVGIDVNGFRYVDVFNTLGLDPRVIRVVDLADLERRRRQAAFSLHPDRLREQPPPAHTSLERLNALVEYIADHPASTARLIKQLNERATIGLHNTHRLSNFFPQSTNTPAPSTPARPAPSSAPRSAPSSSAQDAPAASPFERSRRPYASGGPISSPFDRERRPYTSTTTPTGGESYGRTPRFRGSRYNPGSNAENPFVVSDDEDVHDQDSPSGAPRFARSRNSPGRLSSSRSGARPRRGPTSTSSANSGASGAVSRRDLASLRRMGQDLNVRSRAGYNPSTIVIGHVRRRADPSSTRPEYPVTAAWTTNRVTIRVWSVGSDGERLSTWGSGGGSSSKTTPIAREDIGALGVQYPPFDGMTRDELIRFMRFMGQNNGHFAPNY